MFNLDNEKLNWIIQSYQDGMSANRIGKAIGKDHHYIRKLLTNHGIKLRPKRESHKAAFPSYPTELLFNNHPVLKTPDGRFFYYTPCLLDREIRVHLIEILCSCCGKTALASKNKNKSGNRYCSPECRYKMQSGENNYNWKGHTKVRKYSGHILKYAPNHPKARNNFVYEHRLVMEAHIGRYLNDKEFVHHINGIKHDNRIENLIICSSKEHNLAHASVTHLLKDLLDINIIEFDKETKKYKMKIRE